MNESIIENEFVYASNNEENQAKYMIEIEHSLNESDKSNKRPKNRLNKTERKFKRYQEKLAKYKLKKLEKKKQKQEQKVSKNDHNLNSIKNESREREPHESYLSKRDMKKLIIERLTKAYSADAGLENHLKICVDCSFSDKMSPKEMSRLAQQIGRCYATNKSLERPVHFTLCNLDVSSPFYKELERVNSGFSNYILNKSQQPLQHLFSNKLEDLVYLSPDSSEYLDDVNADRVYVIGGLVDETVTKQVTLSKCKELEIRTYALPIEKYMKRKENENNGKYTFNKILTINQVFEILADFHAHKSWPHAFKSSVPKRKGFFVEQNE